MSPESAEAGRQDRHVLQTRELPYLLHIAGDPLIAMIDAEAVIGLGRPSGGDWIKKPVWIGEVIPCYAQENPASGQDLVGRSKGSLPSRFGNLLEDSVRQRGGEAQLTVE